MFAGIVNLFIGWHVHGEKCQGPETRNGCYTIQLKYQEHQLLVHLSVVRCANVVEVLVAQQPRQLLDEVDHQEAAEEGDLGHGVALEPLLVELMPEKQSEYRSWAFLSVTAGITEEIVYRGILVGLFFFTVGFEIDVSGFANLELSYIPLPF